VIIPTANIMYVERVKAEGYSFYGVNDKDVYDPDRYNY
jgi:hypothetical protein